MNIGSIQIESPFFLAPMAGVTDLPTRDIARSFGVGMAYTEMISANAMVNKNYKTQQLIQTSSLDRPLGVQIFGSEPDKMVKTAKILQRRGYKLLDINMGCPVRKVAKTNSGAALLKDLNLAKEIMSKVISSVTIPVTVKIRSGWCMEDKDTAAIIMAKSAEECGISAITVHGRTAKQGYSGKADWNIIGAIKREVSVPVIGNGDITSPEDAIKMLKETSCDAVMIGRASIGSPWLFKQCLQAFQEGTYDEIPPHEKRDTITNHINGMVAYYGERIGVKKIRTHMAHYIREYPGSAKVRTMLNKTATAEEMIEIIYGFFRG